MRLRSASAVLCACVGLATAHLYGKPAALPANVDADKIIVTQVAGHTLYIPKGYVSSFMGFAGNVQINALLPCLLPKTPENAAEFHKNNIGRTVVARLTVWESHSLEGQQLLNTHIANSKFVKERYPDRRALDTGPTPVPGTNFLSYKDILLQRDIFVLSGSHPLFLVNCDRHSPNVPFGICIVWEKIWSNVRLEYWYDRSFLDQDINSSITIDARLQRLLSSFLRPAAEQEQSRERQTCR